MYDARVTQLIELKEFSGYKTLADWMGNKMLNL